MWYTQDSVQWSVTAGRHVVIQTGPPGQPTLTLTLTAVSAEHLARELLKAVKAARQWDSET